MGDFGAGGSRDARSPATARPIHTPDQRLRVFVSSSLTELAEERHAVERAISSLRLTPVMFELGARPHPPQDLYRAYLEQSDVFIGLYWQSYGQLNPGGQVSGLEEEFELSNNLPRLLYVKRPAPERDPRLSELLSRIRDQASYRSFDTPTELGRLVRDDLATLLSERFTASAAAAPPPTAGARGPGPLPVATTPLIGRERDLDDLVAMLGEPGVRLATLTGPGGIGKTRLAVAAAERLRPDFDAGTVFVPLSSVTEPAAVLTGILRAAGADLAGIDSPRQALMEMLSEGRWLLVLDNLEQVVEVAADLSEVLAACPQVEILATSRTVLSIQAEREFPVPSLGLPDDPEAPLDDVAAEPAIALFVDRARAVAHDFALTAENAPAVVEICRRLEGVPLAIELAAARTRLLAPDALLRRLSTSLDALGTGAVDMPPRQQTLRATVDWSVDLLDDTERSLLETLAVFHDGWTISAAAQVAAIDEDLTLDLIDALARHSLISIDRESAMPRWRMPQTLKEFVAERLAARPDADEISQRHAIQYRRLGEQADRHLRGIDHGQWLDRLESESRNLAAAVQWYLDHDRAPLPHLFRALSLFWYLRDHLVEARPWVEQLLPSLDDLDLRSQAELLSTASMMATDVGDDAAALTARDRLQAVIGRVDDPRLLTLCEIALGAVSAIVGDAEDSLRTSLSALEQLNAADEPFWAGVAFLQAGFMESATGRYDAAVAHMQRARDLGRSLNNAWLQSWSQVQLGTLALLRDRVDEARELLDQALDLTLAARSSRTVTLWLVAVARLSYVDGDADRAALLIGAADGVRRRVGLRAWPTLQRGGTELVAQIRQAIGPDVFEDRFAAGARLNQAEAISAARERRPVGTARR